MGLDHPNIVQLCGVISFGSHLPSLVMAFFSKGNIVACLKADPNLSVVKYVRVSAMSHPTRSHLTVLTQVHQVASALAYMHSLQLPVVHGSIKGVCHTIFFLMCMY